MLRIPKLPELTEDLQDLDLINERDYEVLINGQPCEVRACRVSAMPFNRVWPGQGKQRSLDQTELASYITFTADEEVTLTVTVKREFQKAIIRPLSRKVAVAREGSVLAFTLTECGQYVLELDDYHFALHIFYNPVRAYTEEEKKSATYYFGPGLHFEHLVKLKDNESIYVDENAILYASILAEGAKNVKIFGNGVINGSCMERVTRAAYFKHALGNIRIFDSEHIYVEDVILQDSSEWSFSTYNCNGLTVENVKLIGHWRYNSDGIDPCNTSNVLIRNCFVRSFDDSICVKGIQGKDITIENFVVEHCVLWSEWGQALEIGGESGVAEIKDIYYRNCDIIHITPTAMDVRGMWGGADIHDVTYENINIEVQKSYQQPIIYHERDEQTYDPSETEKVEFIFRSENRVIRLNYEWFDAEGWSVSGRPVFADIHDITLRNIYITLEDGAKCPEIFLLGVEGFPLHDYTFDGIYVNGERLTDFNQLKSSCKHVENIVLR